MEDALIVAIVFSFLAFMSSGIYKLIKAKIDQGSGIPDEAFDRLAKAFIQYKKDTERRLQNLEAIVTDEDGSSSASSNKQKQLDKPHKTIEIEDDSGKEKEQSRKDSGNLRNMLRE